MKNLEVVVCRRVIHGDKGDEDGVVAVVVELSESGLEFDVKNGMATNSGNVLLRSNVYPIKECCRTPRENKRDAILGAFEDLCEQSEDMVAQAVFAEEKRSVVSCGKFLSVPVC